MSGILAMLNYVLPQALILVGLAGITVLAVRGIRVSRLITAKFHVSGENNVKVGKALGDLRQTLAKNSLGALEKTLRRAKIIALKFDNFVSAKLQRIATIKRARAGGEGKEDFWQYMKRGRMAFMRRKKIEASVEKPESAITPNAAVEPKDDTFLQRVASEHKSEYTDEGGAGSQVTPE